MQLLPETREALDAAAKAALVLRGFWGPYWNGFDMSSAVAAEAHYAASVVEYVRCRRVNEGEVDEEIVLGEIQARIPTLSVPEITAAALDAFWATVAAAHPGAAGDFLPDEAFREQAQREVCSWVEWNVAESPE